MNPGEGWLLGIGQCMLAMQLYPRGHPAREKVVDNTYEKLLTLLEGEPEARFSILGREVVHGKEVLVSLEGWPWASRMTQAGIERIEISMPVTREEFERFLIDMYERLNRAPADTAMVRQQSRPSIRFGAIQVAGTNASDFAHAITTATMSFSLREESETIKWMHREVAEHNRLPMAEVEAVVQSLSIAMHQGSSMLLPLLELKEYDQYTTTHSANVSVLAMGLAEAMGLNPGEVRVFGIAGLLHDLGKVRIPIEILNKAGPYTEQERAIMQQHPVEGAKLLLTRQQELDLAAVVSYEHHILLNGKGYPNLSYRRPCHPASHLVHVCDVYDALCTNRPYRDAWGSEVALAYMEEHGGTEFEPEALRVFAEMMRRANRQYVAVEEDAPTGSPAET
ncbi:MAG: HD domain-containing phosphohydrolase [Gemmatimonadota bacterium]